jgi:hypothetical protein
MSQIDRNKILVNIFLKKILEVRAAQSNTEAGLLAPALSKEALSKLEIEIRKQDLLNCDGIVHCGQCSFSEFSGESEVSCSFIHTGCAAWH